MMHKNVKCCIRGWLNIRRGARDKADLRFVAAKPCLVCGRQPQTREQDLGPATELRPEQQP
jgi:hypothetical protein